jgi:hypothetical protein
VQQMIKGAIPPEDGNIRSCSCGNLTSYNHNLVVRASISTQGRNIARKWPSLLHLQRNITTFFRAPWLSCRSYYTSSTMKGT